LDRKHMLIILVVLILGLLSIVFVILQNSINIPVAHIPGEILSDEWYEDASLRTSRSYLFGFEQCRSVTYKFKNNDSSAILVIITVKSLGSLSTNELAEKMDYFLQYYTKDKGIIINESSKRSGERVHPNGHKTTYMILRGERQYENITFNIRLISEAWNCDVSGTSVICVGYSYTTYKSETRVYEDNSRYKRIVEDQQGSIDGLRGDKGLISNVVCHVV